MASEMDNIKVEFKENKVCSRIAEITIAAPAVADAFAKAYKQAAKEVQIAGFRKGKAPVSIVKARYGSYVKDDVIRSFQQQAYSKVMQGGELDIIGAGAPEGMDTLAEDKDFTFTFPVEIAPSFTLPEYKGIEVKLEGAKDPEKAFADHKEYMKGLYAEYVAIEDAAKEGDTLKVSYEADYALADDASAALKRMVKAEESWLWLAEPEQIPGMLKAMTGAKKGDEVKFEAAFPADWREAALAGKTVNYTVKVAEIQRRVPVESEEKLAEKLGMESVEKMHEFLKEKSKNEMEEARKAQVKAKIADQIVDSVKDFEMPKGILAMASQREFSRIADQLVRKEEDVEKFKADREKHLADAKTAAEKRLKKFFILRKIAAAENITVTDEEVNMQIRQMCAYLGYKEKDVRQMLENNGGYSEIESDILMDKVITFAAEQAQA